MRCSVCSQPISPTEPIKDLPECAGGGHAHVECWKHLVPYLRRLHLENGVPDELGVLTEDGEDDGGA